MKLAIVFDDLIQFGGAERLLLAVHELYPDVPVLTSVASEEWVIKCAELKIRLVTSFMQHLPLKRQLNRFYGLLGLHTLAFESFCFDTFDVVVSISARFAHGVITKPGTIHICYMNSPGRMIWEPSDYFDREGFMSNKALREVFQILSSPFLSLLRLWDFAAAQRVDYFIANSKTPQQRIKKYYGRGSQIIYPFADMEPVRSQQDPAHPGDYYLAITRLAAWKRVDVAISACRKAGVRLKIVGDGPDKNHLKEIAGNNPDIEFLGYVDEGTKRDLIYGCRALIVTQKEDFGITAVEVMALGKPVIAYRAGGVLETVVEGKTGEFYDEQDGDCLAKALSSFVSSKYRREDCFEQAGIYSKDKFLTGLDGFIKNVYHSKNNLP